MGKGKYKTGWKVITQDVDGECGLGHMGWVAGRCLRFAVCSFCVSSYVFMHTAAVFFLYLTFL